MKSTNYINTLIEVAEDCKTRQAKIPPMKVDKKTIANIQFEMMAHHPYEYTSDDVIYAGYAAKEGNEALSREEYFARGRACLRTSPLAKTYGWGIHSNEEGKVAIYALESDEYQKLQSDKNIEHTKAMRSKRA